MPRAISLFLAAVLVSGCAAKLPEVQLENNFQNILKTAMQDLPCQSASVKAPFDPQEADFICTGGRFEQLYLRMNRKGDYVSQVTLHWKEHEKSAYLYERDTHVKPFLDFVAREFLSSDYKFTYATFFGNKPLARAEEPFAITFELGEDESQAGEKYTTRKLEILYR